MSFIESKELHLAHDIHKILLGDSRVSVGIGGHDHIRQHVIIHNLPQLLADLLQLVEVNVPRLIVIEEIKRFLNFHLDVFLAQHLALHHREELVEVNGARPCYLFN